MDSTFFVTKAHDFLGHFGVDVWIAKTHDSARMTVWVDRSNKITITGGVAFPEESTINGIKQKSAWLALVASVAEAMSRGVAPDECVARFSATASQQQVP